MELIDYQNVEIRQREETVLRNVNLRIHNGDFVYLLGKVGSGKSTLMKTFYAELPIYSGDATFLGYDLSTITLAQIPYLRRKIGVVFQDFQLLPDRSVEDNLLFVLQATGWKDRQVMLNHAHDMLAQVGMADKGYKMPYHLSGGEQQRVVIARALLNTPDVILADEPTGNLDQQTGEDIMNLLYGISQAGMTVIMSTHNPRWPEKYPGRMLYFSNGEISEANPNDKQSL
ncbi:MAG: ATP-binding cassette domain-containing protein [Paludibacteraceae bacterium]|nr:ATP-binding cassette domain-containing protein [Paludibacteraceae bacterium]